VDELAEVPAAVAAPECGALEPGAGGGGSAVQGKGVPGSLVEGVTAGDAVGEGCVERGAGELEECFGGDGGVGPAVEDGVPVVVGDAGLGVVV